MNIEFREITPDNWRIVNELEDCGGNHIDNYGVKDCTNCIIPHRPKGYDYINKKLMEINQR